MGFQIFVKNLVGSTITLEVETDSTINDVISMLNTHEEKFMGYSDIFESEAKLWDSNRYHLTFEGKELEVNSTLSDNNIVNDSTLWIQYGLYGGGKRARASADARDMAVLENDCEAVKQCFAFNEASFKKWFKGLPTEKQLEFLKMAKTYKQNPDRLMNHAAGLAPQLVALQAAVLFYRGVVIFPLCVMKSMFFSRVYCSTLLWGTSHGEELRLPAVGS